MFVKKSKTTKEIVKEYKSSNKFGHRFLFKFDLNFTNPHFR